MNSACNARVTVIYYCPEDGPSTLLEAEADTREINGLLKVLSAWLRYTAPTGGYPEKTGIEEGQVTQIVTDLQAQEWPASVWLGRMNITLSRAYAKPTTAPESG